MRLVFLEHDVVRFTSRLTGCKMLKSCFDRFKFLQKARMLLRRLSLSCTVRW